MSALTSEFVTEELDDEFDLNIRIDEFEPIDTRPDRFGVFGDFTSCSVCCVVQTYGCPPTNYVQCPGKTGLGVCF